ncbi:MAG: choice-of-anchor J domain-containing protein, partial [Bacteroidota bacterium]|nr:choice-of-anchor J domain-containing protein [Bacteroidota bacterium]
MYCLSFGQCHYVIDMQDSYGDGWNGASIAVNVNGTVLANWGLTSGSAGSDSLETLNGDVVDFLFTGGSWDSEITFQITDPAGNNIYNGGAPAAGSFLNHTSNSTCVPATVNVTFQVDMNQVTAGFTTPEVNGTWNAWCGNCNPMTDADGDGIWEATIPLLSGSYEYKFSADNWTIQEMNDPTASCTNGNATYTNRVLSVGTADITVPVVCWGSCDPCFYSPQPPVGVTCSSGNPGVGFSDDCEAQGSWTGDFGNNGYWKVGTGGTPSGFTGPSGAHSGSSYFFFESSTGGLDTATIVTPAVDLTAAVGDAELTFYMYAYGSAINTLDVGVSTSATGPFTTLYTSSGEVQIASDPWAHIGVSLASYVGQTVYVSFTYTRGSAGTSYQADMAIDLVAVNACFNCVAPSGVMASNITTNSADVSWTAGGSETEWMMVVNGTSSVVTSSTQALTGLTSNTNYDVQVAAICGAGDTSAMTPVYSFSTACGVAVAPYMENFDAGFNNCWAQDTADVFDWTLDAGGTPSSGTGPSDDMTGGGNYMFTEASVPRAHGDVATMMTEDIDISALTNPELNFYSHMYGSAQGTMSVDIYDGTSYTNIFSKSGDQGDVWVEESVL